MEWEKTLALADYEFAVARMEQRVAEIRAGKADELIWLVEHPPLYTAGSSARASDLLDSRFAVYETGRGGQYTYHGPGQRVAYVMLDLKRRYAPDVPDLRQFVQRLEQWIMLTLAEFGVEAFTRQGRIGVWVETKTGEKKIAALGIRIRNGVSYHGIAINVNPDLSHYAGIVPCGIREFGVTSLHDLGVKITMNELDEALERCFREVF